MELCLDTEGSEVPHAVKAMIAFPRRAEVDRVIRLRLIVLIGPWRTRKSASASSSFVRMKDTHALLAILCLPSICACEAHVVCTRTRSCWLTT